MDIVYLVKHSSFEDLELRYSLRSVAQFVPWVRKVWIFGDRPKFLSDDWSAIEHVPWEAVAWTGRFTIPVKNQFLQYFLVSLWPELDFEFLIFCDDYVLLNRLPEAVAKRDRYKENLDDVKSRGTGLWKQSLWRSYDWLKRLGYPTYNFHTHLPIYMTKKRVFDAYADLEDFVTEDRFAGMLAESGILNHAYRQQRFPLTLISEEGLYAGFHDKPSTHAQIVEKTRDKLFLNFDENGFNEDMQRFLAERFPQPCLYETA